MNLAEKRFRNSSVAIVGYNAPYEVVVKQKNNGGINVVDCSTLKSAIETFGDLVAVEALSEKNM